jgi:hypothetical protein
MACIYMYSCSPNYPGIRKAFAIFAMEDADKASPVVVGRTLAEQCGCTNIMEKEKLVVIAADATVIEYIDLFDGYPIIDYETGEY